jgi:hypothetical protein
VLSAGSILSLLSAASILSVLRFGAIRNREVWPMTK